MITSNSQPVASGHVTIGPTASFLRRPADDLISSLSCRRAHVFVIAFSHLHLEPTFRLMKSFILIEIALFASVHFLTDNPI
jgi:hypothetical protein